MTTMRTPLSHWALFASAPLWLAACRIGGPSAYEQPSLDVRWPPDSGDSGEELPGEDTAISEEDTMVADTTADVPTEVDGDAGAETDEDAALEGAVCTPGTPAACDPVQNTGCSPGSRCTTSSTPNTGRCVYLGPVGVGGFCTATDGAIGFLGTDTCQTKLACLSNKCVALCWCDTDCASGSCCNVAFGTTGFKGCGSCP
jgi:hypothetical protein